jgi:hypothetical protein
MNTQTTIQTFSGKINVPDLKPCFCVSQIWIRNYLDLHVSGSFHQQAKTFRETLISTILQLLNDLLPLKKVTTVS